ncbi:hypothetical protein TorRG33x02_037640 [Trema orientale]|uniref:Uncharacterized protein n=1 Tax=Trema orientale TaxID=63057 RepID=A0A2P5FRF7_TREOI|nr:hypothetical protein TorRG33x02_037640 [Trema orientale]
MACRSARLVARTSTSTEAQFFLGFLDGLYILTVAIFFSDMTVLVYYGVNNGISVSSVSNHFISDGGVSGKCSSVGDYSSNLSLIFFLLTMFNSVKNQLDR